MRDVCLLGTNKDEAEVNDISPKRWHCGGLNVRTDAAVCFEMMRSIAIYSHPLGTRAGSVNIP